MNKATVIYSDNNPLNTKPLCAFISINKGEDAIHALKRAGHDVFEVHYVFEQHCVIEGSDVSNELRLKNAHSIIKAAVIESEDYAAAWHLSVFGSCVDVGVDPHTAEKAADLMLKRVFNTEVNMQRWNDCDVIDEIPLNKMLEVTVQYINSINGNKEHIVTSAVYAQYSGWKICDPTHDVTTGEVVLWRMPNKPIEI